MMVRRVLRNQGLSLVLFLLFLLTWTGQWLAGWQHFNHEQEQHGQPALSATAYLGRGEFWQATGENWESEFLQMALFVVLTACLYQKGSPESNDPDAPEDDVPLTHDSPWPARRGGIWRALYRYSLSVAFAALFLASMIIHALGGWRVEQADDMRHAHPPSSFTEYLGSSRFWFESMQNWQSEFLSLVAMVFLSVYLRHDGSAESKPVNAPHDAH